MSHVVYKYPFEIVDEFTIDLPEGARILEARVQKTFRTGEIACIWALVDKDAPVESVHFRLAGTGHPIENPNAWDHVSTFMMSDDRLVWHLFVRRKSGVVVERLDGDEVH